MQRFLLVILLVSWMGGPGCNRLVNTFHPTRMECGEDAVPGQDYTKVFGPESMELTSGELVAERLNSSQHASAEFLPVTSRYCLPKTNETVILRFIRPDQRLVYLGALDKDRIELAMDNSSLTMQCRPTATVAESFKPELIVQGRFGIQAFKVELEGGSAPSPIPLLGESAGFKLTDLPEGEQSVRLKSRNLFTHEQQSVDCRIRIDRTDPDVQLLGQPTRVSPDSLLRFASNETAQIHYCLLPNSGRESADETCDFQALKGDSLSAPYSGRWILKYYAVDAAGNASPLSTRPLDVYDDARVGAIQSNLRLLALSAAYSDRIDTAKSLLESHKLRDELKTDAERADVDSLLMQGYWRMGLGLYAFNAVKHEFPQVDVKTCKDRVAVYFPNGTIQIFNSRGVLQKSLSTDSLGKQGSLIWGPACQDLYAVADTGAITHWDQGLQAKLIGSPSLVHKGLALSHDAAYLASSIGDALLVYDRAGQVSYRHTGSFEGHATSWAFVPETHQLLIHLGSTISLVDLDQDKPEATLVHRDEDTIERIAPLAKDRWFFATFKGVRVLRDGRVEEVKSRPSSYAYRPIAYLKAPYGGNLTEFVYIKVGDGDILRCILGSSQCWDVADNVTDQIIDEAKVLTAEGDRLRFSVKSDTFQYKASFAIQSIQQTPDSLVASGPGNLVFLSSPDGRFAVPSIADGFFFSPRRSWDQKYYVSFHWLEVHYAPVEQGLSAPKTIQVRDQANGVVVDVMEHEDQFYCFISTSSGDEYLQYCNSDEILFRDSRVKPGLDGHTLLRLKDSGGLALHDISNLDEPILIPASDHAGFEPIAFSSRYFLSRSGGDFRLQVGSNVRSLHFEAASAVSAFDDFLVVTEPSKKGVSIVGIDQEAIIHRPDLALTPSQQVNPGRRRAVFYHIDNPRKLVIWQHGAAPLEITSNIFNKFLDISFDQDYMLISRFDQTIQPLAEIHNLKDRSLFTYHPSERGPQGLVLTGSGLQLLENQRIFSLGFGLEELRKDLCFFARDALSDPDRRSLCPGSAPADLEAAEAVK